MIIEEQHTIKTDAEEQFAALLTKKEVLDELERRFVTWLITQKNARGTLYLESVAWQYVRYLKTAPKKLDVSLTTEERNVFFCITTAEFDELYDIFLAAPNFKIVNENGHQSFSAGLQAYRRYLKSLERQGEIANEEEQPEMGRVTTVNTEQLNNSVHRVDFGHTELCSDCNPVTCTVNGDKVPVGTWRDLLMTLVTKFTAENPNKINELYKRPLLTGSARPFLLKDKPNGAAKQTTTGHWVYVNLNISALVDLIGKLCQYCGVNLNDVEITYTPKSSGMSSEMEHERNDGSSAYTEQSIREEFRTWLTEQHPDWSSNTVTMHYPDAYYIYNNKRGVTLEEALTAEDGLQRAYDAIEPAPNVPDAVMDVLNNNYASGFRFETTYLNLLSSASGVEVDGRMQSAMKRSMFRRDDGIYFLLDMVADASTRKDIVDFADSFLEEYGCFEIPEFYKLYEDKINPKCISNADDFESFYEQIGKSGVRCVQAPYIGNRIARCSNGNVWGTFKEIAVKIVSVIADEYYGSCNEDDLHTKFCAFSTDLLGKIIRNCASDELIRVEINDSICYQTFDALGLPDDFPNVLEGVLERLGEIGLDPTRDVLHTAISLRLGVNFMAEFNLPDWDTFQRLIAAFYKAEPRRKWKHYNFGEVTN